MRNNHRPSFIRAMSWKKVVEDTDPPTLTPEVSRIVFMLRRSGLSPIEEMRKCISYINDHLGTLQRTYSRKHFLIRNTDPKKLGTRAWYEYLRENTQQILGVLIDQDVFGGVGSSKEVSI